MQNDELNAIDAVLRAELGGRASWHLCDRQTKNAMNFLLNCAEKYLRASPCVFWIENAPPEMFCLRGFSKPVVAFSPRYVELWVDVRAVLIAELLDPESRAAIAEKLALSLIAELSLGKNDSEFTASAVLRSAMAGESLHLQRTSVEFLSLEPCSISYMACWFYGLAHELGHFWCPAESTDDRESFEKKTRAEIRDALEAFTFSPEFRGEIEARSLAEKQDFILGVDHVRNECFADKFATSLLMDSTSGILNRFTPKKDPHPELDFNLTVFIQEMICSLHTIAFIDYCRRAVKQACTPRPASSDLMDAQLFRVALTIRLRSVMDFLKFCMGRIASENDGMKGQGEALIAAVSNSFETLRPSFEAANQGLARALRFALDRERHPSIYRELETWRQACNTDSAPSHIAQSEVIQFLNRARSLGRWCPEFDTILRITSDPSAEYKVELDTRAALVCQCLWLRGPHGFQIPVSHDTSDGRLIFVFSSESELFELYKSRFDLEGEETVQYELISSLIYGNTEQQIRDAVALRLPVGKATHIVFEGTEEFRKYLNELTDEAVWSE